MKCLVFVPGIMGSELRNTQTGERVWPPTIGQILRKNLSTEAISDENLQAIAPISSIARFYPVYRSLLSDIDRCGYDTTGSQGKWFIPFAYDWRLANEVTAAALSDTLNQSPSFDEIVLLGHSMGGLVLRYLLESGEFNQQAWFGKVTQLITLGTPHHGAAAALKQVTGLSDNTAMTKDSVKQFVDDPRYPSAYQLVSPNGTALTQTAGLRNKLPRSVDPFSADIVHKYNLSKSNMQAARWFWSKLDVARRPSTVDYYSFVGSAHKTLHRLDWTGRDLRDTQAVDSGDGTVPISSSVDIAIPHSFSRKNHVSIFTDRQLRFELYRMLGAPSKVEPQSADLLTSVGAPGAMGLSTDRSEYQVRDTMEISISFTEPRHQPHCTLQIMQLDADSHDGLATSAATEPFRVNFEQAEIDYVCFKMSLELAPGVYELVCAGDIDDPQRTIFMVSEFSESE
ncbi:lipase/acyltransferase domain-containing protein [Arenicella xantha]|uniref:Lecithin:cholesterol acyltransferase n=1 Tax=Arenicella xantha TaxID=644221 RepID=A0A395JJR7_9GAMM|nr:hypothetical protein [Arenicella xantha]RBP49142.1 lecithin:cholesterol acyltransferase [Arenicella xantha]